LHLALKTPQGVLQGFTLLDDDFSHSSNSPPIRFGLVSCGASRQPCCRRLCASAGTAPGTDYRTYCPFRWCTLERSLASSNQFPPHKSRNLCILSPPPRY
jgi:hypothetical protein